MNCRDAALVSTATIFGALASAFAYYTFFSNPSKPSSRINSSANGDVSKQRSSQDPFDLQNAKDICRGMIISWQLLFYPLRDPKTQTGWCMLGESKWYNTWYVCHAEVNAILNTNHASAAGQRLYVTMFPCNECAKIIIQVRKHQPQMDQILLKFMEL
ncbi:hypothetical protein ES332_A12G217600v1 [Gossypium tomentosum]|uniref:dCMP deaminase n=1 Tax=Gossypium tomentosum TaxID=34277 RepID=A0A5D2N165_GOSTO|nr:hypothetical protein ES332_A12G217600v1 [Gossypium tomentosum]